MFYLSTEIIMTLYNYYCITTIFGSFKVGSRSHQAHFLGWTQFYVLAGKLVLVWSERGIHLRYYNNKKSATQGQIQHKEIPIFYPKAYNTALIA